MKRPAICSASPPVRRPARPTAGARAAPAVVRAQQQPARDQAAVPTANRTVGSRQLAAAVPAPGRTVSGRQPAPDAAPHANRDDTSSASSPLSAVLAKLDRQWAELPGRYKLVFATSLSFVICNMDKVGAGCCSLQGVESLAIVRKASCQRCFRAGRAASAQRVLTAVHCSCWRPLDLGQVNISVAIIPMAQDFGWSPTVAGGAALLWSARKLLPAAGVRLPARLLPAAAPASPSCLTAYLLRGGLRAHQTPEVQSGVVLLPTLQAWCSRPSSGATC